MEIEMSSDPLDSDSLDFFLLDLSFLLLRLSESESSERFFSLLPLSRLRSRSSPDTDSSRRLDLVDREDRLRSDSSLSSSRYFFELLWPRRLSSSESSSYFLLGLLSLYLRSSSDSTSLPDGEYRLERLSFLAGERSSRERERSRSRPLGDLDRLRRSSRTDSMLSRGCSNEDEERSKLATVDVCRALGF
jgi:hypothetical protein